MQHITIGLADDHNLFREGIKSLLHKMEGIALLLEATNGQDLLEKLEHHVPDVLLLDLEMDIMDGIEATSKIKESFPEIKIIILTMHKEERMISYLMELGVHGYLLKDTTQEELEKAIHSVYEKGFYFNHFVSTVLVNELRNKRKVKPKLSSEVFISNREQEVLELIAKEYTTPEIAEKLFISTRTVEGHRKNLISKFGVKNTAGLLMKAIRQGFISM